MTQDHSTIRRQLGNELCLPVEFERHRVKNQEVKSSSLLPIIGVSLFGHLVLGAWLLHSPVGIKTELESIEKPPIKAKLVFVDLTEPIVLPNENTEMAEPSEPLPIIEPSDDIDVSPLDEAPAIVQNENNEPTLADRRDNLPALELPQNGVTEPPETSISGQQSGGTISRDLARKHLQNYQSQAINRLSSQQAKRHQQAKNSPDLQIPQFDPFTTEDEKFHAALDVRVDCSSTLNKTLSVLSGITGGALKCSKGADLTPFIKKHLDKDLAVADRKKQN